MPIVVDATSSPSVQSLLGADVSGVCRYLSWPHRWGGVTHTSINPKIIQQDEFNRLHNAGLDVTLNWEYDDHDWMGNSAAGEAHAQEAIRQARALGYPRGCVIIGSADFDVTHNDWDSNCRGYAWAWANMLRGSGYKAGVYGPYDLLTWCRDLGVFDTFWQAGMSWSWSGGRNRNRWPGAHLRQLRHQTIGGIDCDVNEIIQPEYGQYHAEGIHEDMALDPLQAAQVNNSERYLQSIFGLTDKAVGVSDTQTSKDLPSPFTVAFRQLVADVAALKAAQAQPVDLDALAEKVAKLISPAIVPIVSGAVRDSINGATISAHPAP